MAFRAVTRRALQLVHLAQGVYSETAARGVPLCLPSTDTEARTMLRSVRDAPLLPRIHTPSGEVYCPISRPTTWVSAAIVASALQGSATATYTISLSAALHRRLVHAPRESPGPPKGVHHILNAVRWGMKPPRRVAFEHCFFVETDTYLLGGARAEWGEAERACVLAWKRREAPLAGWRDAAFEEKLASDAAFVKRVLRPLHRLAH